MLKKVISDERGRVLILVLIILAIGILLIPVFLSHASTNLLATRATQEGLKEQYAADSGIEYALWQLQTGVFTGTTELGHRINNKGVEVTWSEYISPTYVITSTAISDDGSSTTIVSYIRSGVLVPSMFGYAAAALGNVGVDCDLDFSGNFSTTGSIEVHGGDLYANGNICLAGSAEIDGDAAATGTISCPTEDCDEILGEKMEGAPPVAAPDIDIAALRAEAEAGGMWVGNKTINDDDTLGPLRITGDLRIQGNATVTLLGTVYVDGTIDMQGGTNIRGGHHIVADGEIKLTGNTQLNPENIPLVISTAGKITITGTDWTSAIIYAPNDNVEFIGNAMLYGAAVGKRVTGTGSAKIEYPPNLIAGRDLPAGVAGLLIITYNINP